MSEHTPNENSAPLEERLASHLGQQYGEPRQASELWQSIAPQLQAKSMTEARRSSNGFHTRTSEETKKIEQWMPLPTDVARRRRLPIAMLPAAALVLLIAGSLLFWLWQPNPKVPVVADGATPRPTSTVAAPTPAEPSPAASGTEVIPAYVITNVAPSDWALEGSILYEYGVDPTLSYRGSEVAFLKSDNPEAPDYGALRQLVSIESLVGKRVRFSANVKTEGVERRAGLWMTVSASSFSESQTDAMLDRPIKSTNDWHLYEVVIDVPSDATMIQFGAQLSGKGQVWVSEARLEVVGEDIALTGPVTPYNPGFEERLTSWNAVQKHAAGTRGGYEVAPSTDVVHSGKMSASVKGLVEEPIFLSPVYQSLPAKPYLGKRIRFSAHLKTQDVEKWAGLSLRVEGPMKGPGHRMWLAHDNMDDRPIRGTSDWQRYDVVLDVPDDASRIVIGLLLVGKGQVWLDDVMIEEVGKEIAVTGPVTLDSPQNLTFEDGLIGWRTGDGTYEVILDRTEAHGGRLSAHLKPRAPATDYGYIYQYLSAEPYKGKRIRVSAYVKTRNLGQDAQLSSVAEDLQLDLSSHAESRSSTIPEGTSDWRKYEVVMDVPPTTKSIVMSIDIQGTGEIWLDDVLIEVVGLEVPTTAPPK